MPHVEIDDRFAMVAGFNVEIDGATGKEVDTAWESVSGGELNIELTETTIGSDRFQTTSPGHKSVGEITLRGAMTNKRKAMCQWIMDTVSGQDWKRTVTITALPADGSPARQFVYLDCFPTRYVFPRLAAGGEGGLMMEELSFAYRERLVR